jgi:hypothetical protein
MDRTSHENVEGLHTELQGLQPLAVTERKLPRTTAWYHKKGRATLKTKAERQQYLIPPEEKALVSHILRMAALGTPIRVKYIPALAFSLARRRCTTKATKPPNKNWPQAFRRRHPQLRSRKTSAMDWKRHDNNIADKIPQWFEVIEPELRRPEIKPENVYNMDETGVMLSMLGSITVLVDRSDKRDYRGAGVKRTMVTAIECISASGECLKPMIIWPASTHRDNWTKFDTPGWVYAFSESGYNDSYISLQWMKQVFDPQTKPRANGKPRILIYDGFGTHETLEILEFCFENNIVLCRLPSHTSHKLQPCDVAVFGPLKTAYREQVEQLYHSGVTTINKEHFTSLYSPARTKALTKKNILAGWAKAGLFPYNPDRVLRTITKLEISVPDHTATEVSRQCPQNEVVQTPATPATPTSSEELVLLLDQIKLEPHDEASKQRKQKLINKLGNAAEKSFAKEVLYQDHIQFLAQKNNEAKTRRATKSATLSVARVVTFEVLQEERAKRAEKAAAKEAKGKARPGRKPKSTPLDAGEATASKGKRGRRGKIAAPEPDPQPELICNVSMQASGTKVVGEAIAREPWRAPVAKMW